MWLVLLLNYNLLILNRHRISKCSAKFWGFWLRLGQLDTDFEFCWVLLFCVCFYSSNHINVPHLILQRRRKGKLVLEGITYIWLFTLMKHIDCHQIVVFTFIGFLTYSPLVHQKNILIYSYTSYSEPTVLYLLSCM